MTARNAKAFLDNLQEQDFKAIAALGSYVYCYLSVKGVPYYVGISRGERRALRKHCFVKVPPIRSRIVVLRSGLTIEQSLDWERFYIKHYGRRDIGTGILLNRTDGGETFEGVAEETAEARQKRCNAAGRTKTIVDAQKYGQCPLVWHVVGDKERRRVRRRIKLGHTGASAWKFGTDYKKVSQALTGKKASAETREKLRQAHLGRKQSPELIEKRIAPLRGRKLSAERVAKSCISRLVNKIHAEAA